MGGKRSYILEYIWVFMIESFGFYCYLSIWFVVIIYIIKSYVGGFSWIYVGGFI